MIRNYRRRLPHIDAPGNPVFVTWRLAGTLPASRSFPSEKLTTGRQFIAYDRILDAARFGPRYLANPSIAAIVVERLYGAEKEGLCFLDCFVVMPNYIHVVWEPRVRLPRLIQMVKGGTARFANQILERAGPFWQQEYFDRAIRNDKEYLRIRRYIEQNPVRAGLCRTPESWPWSSANRQASLKARAG